MINDNLRFRIWDINEKKYLYWESLKNNANLGEILDKNNTLSQIIEPCTGKKDINGKFIYVGDIVKGIFSESCKYVSDNCTGIVYQDKIKEAYTIDNCLLDMTCSLEVIGNVNEK